MRTIVFSLVAASTIFGCGSQPETTALSKAELDSVRATIQSYANAWVAGDSTGVLGLFTDDAVIIPSGLPPREGVQAIREFWFPHDSSVTEVHSYVITVLDAGGSGDHAYTIETGDLSFTYALGDYSFSKTSTAYATTLYSRDSGGRWKIHHRMWTDMRIEH